jgi:membrane protein YqaA with SNARE-associated domain
MKKEKQATESRLQTIGEWVKGVSFVLMFAAFVACVLDVVVVTRGALTVPFWGYLVVIGTGVALQFVGAAIPNMKFGSRSIKPNQAKPYRIDN